MSSGLSTGDHHCLFPISQKYWIVVEICSLDTTQNKLHVDFKHYQLMESRDKLPDCYYKVLKRTSVGKHQLTYIRKENMSLNRFSLCSIC